MVVGSSFFESKSIGETMFIGALGGAFAAFGIMPLMVGFKKGGLFRVILGESALTINKVFTSKEILLTRYPKDYAYPH
jgi:hypothetical protein